MKKKHTVSKYSEFTSISLPKAIRYVLLCNFLLAAFSINGYSQTIYRSEEQQLKKAALAFFQDYTAFLNQLGNGNIQVEDKKKLIAEFGSAFFMEKANVEQDLRPEGKGRVVRVKPYEVYLNNLGVYYSNVAITHSNVNISNICKDETGQLFFIIVFERAFEAIDRNERFITSTKLNRDLYLNVNLSDTTAQTDFAIRNIAFSERKDLSSLEVPILPDPKFIEVINPSGNSSYMQGEAMNINWQSNAEGNVRIELYRNGYPEKIINSNAANTGSIYGKRLNFPLPYDTTYQIKITSILDASIFDLSAPFTIGKAQRRKRNKKEGNGSMMAGLRGGTNFSYIGQTGFGYDALKSGGNVGVALAFPLKDGLALRSGFNLSERGAKFEENGSTELLHLQYFELPVYIDFYFNKWNQSSFKYFMGLHYSFMRQATYTSNANGNSFTFFGRGNEELTDSFNSSELSINLGIGYEFAVGETTKLFMDAQYLYGLSGINNESLPDTGVSRANMYNRGFSVGLGILIMVTKNGQ